MTSKDLQHWMNGHGQNVTVDGKWGPQSRAALIDVFRNRNAPAATPAEIAMVAARLGCTPRQLRAVANVESAGGGWDEAGLLKLLWERHYLWRRIKLAVPFLSDPTPGGYTIDVDHDGICDSWEKLADATGRFGFNVAAECASYGAFQIMGANWKALGYGSVLDFVWQLSRTEFAHYDAFGRFIWANGLTQALRRVNGSPANCLDLARGYNGKAQKGYHDRIAAAWRAER